MVISPLVWLCGVGLLLDLVSAEAYQHSCYYNGELKNVSDTFQVEIELTTAYYADEIEVVINKPDEIIRWGDLEDYETYSLNFTLENGDLLTIDFDDEGYDGWHGGQLTVKIDGEYVYQWVPGCSYYDYKGTLYIGPIDLRPYNWDYSVELDFIDTDEFCSDDYLPIYDEWYVYQPECYFWGNADIALLYFAIWFPLTMLYALVGFINACATQCCCPPTSGQTCKCCGMHHSATLNLIFALLTLLMTLIFCIILISYQARYNPDYYAEYSWNPEADNISPAWAICVVLMLVQFGLHLWLYFNIKNGQCCKHLQVVVVDEAGSPPEVVVAVPVPDATTAAPVPAPVPAPTATAKQD